MTAACFVEHQGLLSGQGYIIKSYATIKGQSGEDVTLIKVKNPFKKSEINANKDNWTGKYSQSDKFWTEETRAKAGPLEAEEFWMSVEDFKDSFKSYTVTYLNTELKNSFIEKRNAQNKKNYKFNFTIADDHFTEAQS